MNLYQTGLAFFIEWLNVVADVHLSCFCLQTTNPTPDRAESSYKENAKGPSCEHQQQFR